MNANERRIKELVVQVAARQAAVSRMEAAIEKDKLEIQDLMVAEGLTKMELRDLEKLVLLKDQTSLTYKVAEILTALPVEEAAKLVKVGRAEAFDKAVRLHPELAELRESRVTGKVVAIGKLPKKA